MKAVLLCLLTFTSFCQEPKKVLFVGNSLIGYNDTPQLVQDLMESNNEQFEIFSFTSNGANLVYNFNFVQPGLGIKKHAKNVSVPENWDVIILQQGSVTFYIKNSFDQTLEKIEKYKEKLNQGGKIYLMENYPFSYKYPIDYCRNFTDFANYELGDPENIVCSDTLWSKEEEERLIRQRMEIVKLKNKIEVIPMIELVNEVSNKYSKSKTFIEGYHPSPLLSQFMAFRFYTAITGNGKVDVNSEEAKNYNNMYRLP